jgi:hypothetical protein
MYIGQRNYKWESEEIVVGEYQAGTVMIDIIDASVNQMIWQGGVKGAIANKDQQVDKTVITAMKKLFKKYPVKPIK